MTINEARKRGEDERNENISQRHNVIANADQVSAVENQSGTAFFSRPMIRVNDLIQKERPKKKFSRDSRTVIDPFGIADLIIDPSEVRPNNTVTISFKAVNNSDVYSMYTISLKINGEVVAAEVMKLPPGVSMPLYFTVSRDTPGEYTVKVNHLESKFIVIDNIIECPHEEMSPVEGDAPASDARFELGLSEISSYLQQKQSMSEKISDPASGMQSGINKAADLIEQGLDKVGDGLVFPIVKLVDASGKLLKVIRRQKAR